MKKVNFEITMNKERNLPKCVNCGGEYWKVNKKGMHYCTNCGHEVKYCKTSIKFRQELNKICKKGL